MSAAAAASASRPGQAAHDSPSPPPVVVAVEEEDEGYDALMGSLDGVSAHDELHRMPEACQTALEQAVKQLLANSNAVAAAPVAGGRAATGGDGDAGGAVGKGGGASSLREAKGVVVIEGEMGCGKDETVTWLRRVCCNR